ncbi:MAG: glutathione-disulfide reductase [Vulcanimicrobiota bacterium]
MSQFDFDLLVLGGGSGGVAAARRAAEHGARVAVCEDNQWGGTCVNRGCVPKKLFVYASEFGRARALMPAYGWEPGEPTFSWPTLVENVTRELARLRGFYDKAMSGNGVTQFNETGVVSGPHAVKVGGRTVTAERILLAVGGKPWIPSGIEGKEHAITSDQVFWLEEFPRRILIVGSGYIGTEFAGIFRGLDAEVHQSFRSDYVLPGFDVDVRRHLQQEMEKQGVHFHTGAKPVKIEKRSDGSLQVTMEPAGTLQVDQVLMATGRTPRVEGIGLSEVGVEIGSRQEVVVDEKFQTSVPSIFAIGDCIRRWELTPVAIAEGRALAEHWFNDQPLDFSYSCVATAVFSSPPAAVVGFSEDYLRKQGVGFEIYRTSFRPMKYTLPDHQDKAMLKLLVASDNNKLLGCHLIGPECGELIQILSACLVAGATKKHLDETFAVHPTLSEELVLFRRPDETVPGDTPSPDPKMNLPHPNGD